jgi:hypothetical protein
MVEQEPWSGLYLSLVPCPSLPCPELTHQIPPCFSEKKAVTPASKAWGEIE